MKPPGQQLGELLGALATRRKEDVAHVRFSVENCLNFIWEMFDFRLNLRRAAVLGGIAI